MKKYSWIVALLALALVFTFVACDDGDSSKKKPPANLPDVVFEGDAIVIYAIGDKASDAVVDKNTFALSGLKPATSIGFAYDFPADVLGKGYGAIEVELELLSETTEISPDFISFNAKDSTKIDKDVLIVGHTQQYHNELKIGKITDKEVSAACDGDVCLQYEAGTCVKGAKNSAAYPMSKLTNGLIAFQYNPYAGDITGKPAAADVTATFKIAVTKITFIGSGVEEPPPPPPATPSPDADFNAATGYADITNEWGTSGPVVFDTDTKIISRSGTGNSALFGIKLPAAIDEDIESTDTIVITYIAIITGGADNNLEVTAKKLTSITGNNKSFGDLTPAQYLTLASAGVQAELEITADKYGSYTFTNSDSTYLYFQDNTKDDTTWKLKIISVTKK